jgi:hypothetical protein
MGFLFLLFYRFRRLEEPLEGSSKGLHASVRPDGEALPNHRLLLFFEEKKGLFCMSLNPSAFQREVHYQMIFHDTD